MALEEGRKTLTVHFKLHNKCNKHPAHLSKSHKNMFFFHDSSAVGKKKILVNIIKQSFILLQTTHRGAEWTAAKILQPAVWKTMLTNSLSLLPDLTVEYDHKLQQAEHPWLIRGACNA